MRKHVSAGTLSYFRTGTGSCTGIGTGFTALASHSTLLPANTDSYYTNQGLAAMTEFPFYRAGFDHWGIRGLNTRWEVDDFANGFQHNTIHQIWLR